MPREDKRTTVVAVLEVVIERGDDIVVGNTGKRPFVVPGRLPNIPRVPQAGLAVKGHEYISRVCVSACLKDIAALCARSHLGVVKGRVIGVAFIEAHVFRRINEERVDVLGDLRNTAPTVLLGIIGRCRFCR